MQMITTFRHGIVAAAALLATLALPLHSPVLAQDETGEAQGPPPAAVRVGDVRQEQLQDRWLVIGRLRETRRVRVASEQTGQIIKVNAEEGDRVEGGKTILAQIEQGPTKLRLDVTTARLAEYEAEVLENEANLAQARRELEYLRDVLDKGSARPKEVKDAEAVVAAEQARVDAALARVNTQKAEVARIKDDISRLSVVAPFDGVVVKKETEVGQWVTPGSTVAEIVALDPIDAVVDVPENLVGNLKVGDAIHVRIESADELLEGKVTAIVPEGGRASRTFPVKVRLANKDLSLKPGMSIRALVPTSKMAQVYTVPRDAVKRTPMGVLVWANMDNKAVPVPVEVMFGAGDRWAVKVVEGSQPGLFPGMSVVTEGAVRVFPGQPLMVLPPDAPMPSASEPTPASDKTTAADAA